MGLAERRLVGSIKNERIPALEETIRGFGEVPIKIDLDWTTFDNKPDALRNLEGLNGFGSIEGAFSDLLRDEIGREAVRNAIVGVLLRNVPHDAPHQVLLKDKHVIIEWCWGPHPEEVSPIYLEPNTIVSALDPLL